MTNSRNLNLLTSGTGLAALGLMIAAFADGSDNGYNDAETSFVFAKSAALETMMPLLIGGLCLTVLGLGAFSKPIKTEPANFHTKPANIHKATAILATVVMFGACFSLFNGFGPEMTGDIWNQPSNKMEKGIFGGLWGGLLAASTGTFLGHTYQAFRAKSTHTDTSTISAPLLS